MAKSQIAKKAKEIVKKSLQNTIRDELVRDSVNNSKRREITNITKATPKLVRGQELTFKELMIADWTDSFADTLSYSFNFNSRILISKLNSFNFYTKSSEVIKNIYLLLNICITHGKMHLLDYNMKRMESSKLPLLQNSKN